MKPTASTTRHSGLLKWYIASGLVLATLSVLDHVALHPRPLVDLAGTWEACSVPDPHFKGCTWSPVPVPAHFVAPKGANDFTHWLRYKRVFSVPEICFEHTCSLVIGEVGDASTILINERLLQQHSVGNQVYEKNIPVTLPLPPSVLHRDGSNTIELLVHSFKLEQTGITHGPVAITRGTQGLVFFLWKTFRSIFLPLACALATAAIALLVSVFPLEALSNGLRRSFYRHATLGSLFMLSFTELPRSVLPMAIAVPGHFLLRLAADWALFALILAFCGLSATLGKYMSRVYLAACAFVGLLLVAGVAQSLGYLPGAEVTSWTYRGVFAAYWLVLLIPLGVCRAAIKQRKYAGAAAIFVGLGVVIHDGLIGFGYLDVEFFSKYHHAVATFIFSALMVRRAAITQTEALAKASTDLQLSKLARQVAHDVRSPLAALNVALDELGQPSEQLRVMMRSAIMRVQDITHELLRKNTVHPTSADIETPEPVMLACLLGAVLSEKRVEYRSKLRVVIEEALDPRAYDSCARIQASQLKRVVSNLINNAVEAFTHGGTVTVVMTQDADGIHITVRDDGQGMPAEVLARLGEKNFSRKQGGHGLGVYGAMEALQAWGGTLKFESTEGVGTAAIIRLPRCDPPAWFARTLPLRDIACVVVLDDDLTIHQVWDERFAHLTKQGCLQLIHVGTPDEFTEKVAHLDIQKTLFLMDYELLGYDVCGLDLVERHGLAARSVLVTSRFEEPDVLERSLHLKVRILPKLAAGYVPLTGGPIATVRQPHAILIDDDTLVATAWRMRAKSAGKSFVFFQGVEDFLAQAEEFDHKTPIYIDSQLGEGLRGEHLAKTIHEAGFQQIFLATGHAADRFAQVPWLRGIRDKTPPF